MDLATFIKESLIQIARGVEEANGALGDTTATVNPRGILPLPKGDTKFYGYLSEEDAGRSTAGSSRGLNLTSLGTSRKVRRGSCPADAVCGSTHH